MRTASARPGSSRGVRHVGHARLARKFPFAAWCGVIRALTLPGGEHEHVIRLTLVFVVVFLVATFPATWLLMLFLGNIGTNVSYWGTLPLGILLSAVLGGASVPRYDTH